MKEHPIIFSTEMVRAILDGRKTQTRRIIKPQPKLVEHTDEGFHIEWFYGPYKVGDRLWAKEDYKYLIQGDMVITYYKYSINKNRVTYRSFNYLSELTQKKLIKGRKDVWKSKLLMFKFMARIFLEVTNIRLERLQDITTKDCLAEGIELIYGRRDLSPSSGYRDYSGTVEACGATASFRTLWESLNYKRGYGWDKNPWVWVIEFKK